MTVVTPISSTTSAAIPVGECPSCGLMRYQGLVHFCGTGARFVALTPWNIKDVKGF